MYSGLPEVGEVKYSVGIKTEQCNLKIAERHGDIIITVTLLRGWNLNDITLTLRTFRDLQYGTSIWKKTPRNLRTDLVQSFSFYLFIFLSQPHSINFVVLPWKLIWIQNAKSSFIIDKALRIYSVSPGKESFQENRHWGLYFSFGILRYEISY